MTVKFKIYGDTSKSIDNKMLIGTNEIGLRKTILYSISWPFRLYKLRRAKSKILISMELETGCKHIEKII